MSSAPDKIDCLQRLCQCYGFWYMIIEGSSVNLVPKYFRPKNLLPSFIHTPTVALLCHKLPNRLLVCRVSNYRLQYATCMWLDCFTFFILFSHFLLMILRRPSCVHFCREEFETVQGFASELPVEEWVCCKFQTINRPFGPVVVLLLRR